VNPAGDYERGFAAKPQPLTLEQAARITPPAQSTDTEGMIDVPRMRAYRQHRLREQIRVQGLDALILVEPLSIRYATGVRNCALDRRCRQHAGSRVSALNCAIRAETRNCGLEPHSPGMHGRNEMGDEQ